MSDGHPCQVTLAFLFKSDGPTKLSTLSVLFVFCRVSFACYCCCIVLCTWASACLDYHCSFAVVWALGFRFLNFDFLASRAHRGNQWCAILNGAEMKTAVLVGMLYMQLNTLLAMCVFCRPKAIRGNALRTATADESSLRLIYNHSTAMQGCIAERTWAR